MNKILLTGAVLGLLSVIIGASAEHLIRARVEPEVFRWVMTAIRYHQIGALVVTVLGVAMLTPLNLTVRRRLAGSALLFVLGTLLFSFTIYAAALSGIEALTRLTPIGGVLLMAAWGVLGWAALAHRGNA